MLFDNVISAFTDSSQTNYDKISTLYEFMSAPEYPGSGGFTLDHRSPVLSGDGVISNINLYLDGLIDGSSGAIGIMTVSNRSYLYNYYTSGDGSYDSLYDKTGSNNIDTLSETFSTDPDFAIYMAKFFDKALGLAGDQYQGERIYVLRSTTNNDHDSKVDISDPNNRDRFKNYLKYIITLKKTIYGYATGNDVSAITESYVDNLVDYIVTKRSYKYVQCISAALGYEYPESGISSHSDYYDLEIHPLVGLEGEVTTQRNYFYDYYSNVSGTTYSYAYEKNSKYYHVIPVNVNTLLSHVCTSIIHYISYKVSVSNDDGVFTMFTDSRGLRQLNVSDLTTDEKSRCSMGSYLRDILYNVAQIYAFKDGSSGNKVRTTNHAYNAAADIFFNIKTDDFDATAAVGSQGAINNYMVCLTYAYLSVFANSVSDMDSYSEFFSYFMGTNFKEDTGLVDAGKLLWVISKYVFKILLYPGYSHHLHYDFRYVESPSTGYSGLNNYSRLGAAGYVNINITRETTLYEIYDASIEVEGGVLSSLPISPSNVSPYSFNMITDDYIKVIRGRA